MLVLGEGTLFEAISRLLVNVHGAEPEEKFPPKTAGGVTTQHSVLKQSL